MHDLNYENSDSYRGRDLSDVLAPAYRHYGRAYVNRILHQELEKLGEFYRGQAGFHNHVDSDCNAPDGGYAFIKARRPKVSPSPSPAKDAQP